MIWGLKADFKNDFFFFLMIAQSKEFKRDYSATGTSSQVTEHAVAVSQVLGLLVTPSLEVLPEHEKRT